VHLRSTQAVTDISSGRQMKPSTRLRILFGFLFVFFFFFLFGIDAESLVTALSSKQVIGFPAKKC